MPSISPSSITTLRANGSSDMGTVGSDGTTPRFWHPEAVPWVLCFIRVHFEDLSGSATGTADCAVFKDRRNVVTAHNARLMTLRDVGISSAAGDADQVVQILPDEMYAWAFDAEEAITLTWTNPDDGNMGWGVEVGVAPLSAVRP